MEEYYAAIRELVDAAFNDDNLRKFCFDHYNKVFENFSEGQSRSDRILALVDYVKRYGLEDKVTEEIKTENPYQYEQFNKKLTVILKKNIFNEIRNESESFYIVPERKPRFQAPAWKRMGCKAPALYA